MPQILITLSDDETFPISHMVTGNLISQILKTLYYIKIHSHLVTDCQIFVVFNEGLTLLAAKSVFSKKSLLEPIKFKAPPVNKI